VGEIVGQVADADTVTVVETVAATGDVDELGELVDLGT
jgi:hypothetical protein